jgi:hypothetical protein
MDTKGIATQGVSEKVVTTGATAEHHEFAGEDQKTGQVSLHDSVDHDDEKLVTTKPPTSARDLVTEVLRVEDDPTVSPWTFRMWFIGIGMSVFGGQAQPRPA